MEERLAELERGEAVERRGPRQRLEDILAESDVEEEEEQRESERAEEQIGITELEGGEIVEMAEDIEQREAADIVGEEEVPEALRAEFRPQISECLRCFRKLKRMGINCGPDCDYERARGRIDQRIALAEREGDVRKAADLTRCKELLIDDKCMEHLQALPARQEHVELPELNLDYSNEEVRNACRECYLKLKDIGVDCGSNCIGDKRLRARSKIDEIINQDPWNRVELEGCRALLFGERCMEKLANWEELLELEAMEAMLELEPEEEAPPEEPKAAPRVRVKADRRLVEFITHNLYLPCVHIETDLEITTYPFDFGKKVKRLAAAPANNIGVDASGISVLWQYISYLTFQMVVGFSENPDPATVSATIRAVQQHVTENTDSCRKPLRSLYREDERAPYIADLEVNCARLALMNLLVRLKALQTEYISSPFLSKQDFVSALDIIVSRGRAPDFEAQESDYTGILFSDLERLYTRSVAENFAGLATGAVELLSRLMTQENDEARNRIRNRVHFFAN